MLRHKILFALAIAVAAQALAAPQKEYGEADGQRFEYTSQLQGNGIIHFAGVIQGSGERFALDVDPDGHVEGHFGDRAIEYDVGKSLRDRAAAELNRGVAVAEATPQK